MISSISHDLKGSLSGLDGGIYLVNSGLKQNNRQRLESGWDMVLRNVGHVRSMVLDILYFCKDRTPELAEIDPVELIESVIANCRTKAESLNVLIQTEIPASGKLFLADRRAVQSMLTNLIDNALDACRVDGDGKDHVVGVSLTDEKDWVRIGIEDNGLGMSQEVKEKAFTLFFSSKGAGGTGLGLFIAHKIARSHGGRIDVESEPGKGSRFSIHLPREPHAQKSQPDDGGEPDQQSARCNEIASTSPEDGIDHDSTI
jgi:signal transduction histidine kinase